MTLACVDKMNLLKISDDVVAVDFVLADNYFVSEVVLLSWKLWAFLACPRACLFLWPS